MRSICLAVMLSLAAISQAEPLGRLFFTSEQRLALDNARGQKVKLEVEEKSEEPAPEIMSLNGVVTRNDGQNTVWLNNRPMSDRRTAGGVLVHPQGTASDPVLLMMPQADRPVSLRVGQNLDVTTGQVAEPYSPKSTELKGALAAKQGEAQPDKNADQGRVPQQSVAGTNAHVVTPPNTAGAPHSRGPTPTPLSEEPRSPTSLKKPGP
jgi:hypothetical protein